MEYSVERYPNIKCFQVDFGEVEVGVTKIECFKIINQTNKKQSYVIQRDALSNPLDCVFHAIEWTRSLLPYESYVCDISYKPILPNRRYIDYFYITDTYHCCYKIIAQGYSIGPKVTSSETRIIMFCENEPFQVTKVVKLINHTSISAKFMFDIDYLQYPFKINETSGIIKASSSKCFSISFAPMDTGIFKYHMPCLISDQKPIILELYGFCYYDSDKKHLQTFRSKIKDIDQLDDMDNFKNYLIDFTSVVKSNPPSILLSSNFIDFGQVKIGLENSIKRNLQTVSLSNQNKYDVYILWEKDISKIFRIRPKKVKVCHNQSIIFEIQFDPLEKQTAYSKDLVARIFRLPCCTPNIQISNEFLMTIIPDFISIRLIGHTYSNNFCNWMPQYEIPETIIMPACFPTLSIYTTFIIRNFGKQSLMFCFISPATSHYSIKPMAGLIHQENEYQLISVQLFPESEGDKAYVERWALRLNGNTKTEIYINFHGYAEEVNLFFGNDYSVIFNPVHVGCEQTQLVLVRNPTRHRVRFEYLQCNFPKELKIQQMNGILDPNETVFHDFIFKPNQLKNYNFTIGCCLSTETGDRKSVVQIELFGNSMYGSLMAIPEELNLGHLAYKESCKTKFKIFNFSLVTIHYLLVCRLKENKQITKNTVYEMKISPLRGTIDPEKVEKIEIVITPTHPGFYDFIIEYWIRPNLSEDSSTSLTESKTLCKLSYTCYLPTLQIKDLLYQVETNKEISKTYLWKSLSIDNFNSTLRTLLPLQETTIEMIVPLIALDVHEKFIIKLLLSNLNPVTASWCLKKKKNCLCNNLLMKNKFTFNRNFNSDCLYCVYDQSCIIQPAKIILMKGETDVLEIIIKDKTLQSCGIFWDLNIGEERHIILNIKLETSIILSGPNLNFNNVYIGNCTYMHYQAVWLYNISKYENIYIVEMKNIFLFNKKNYGIIFTCLNPRGIIQGYNRKPVLFGFRPNRFGKFKISIKIKVGNTESVLNIEAESKCIRKDVIITNETCPYSDTFSAPEMIIHFNKHCIVLPTLSFHKKVVKIFMVHNHHQQNALYFKWKNYEIPGFVKINIEPSSGLIQPQSLITFLIEIFIGFHQCSLDVDLFCDFLDISERRAIEKKKLQKKNFKKQIENKCDITEIDINLKKTVFEDVEKTKKFCKTLSLKINVYQSLTMDSTLNLLTHLKSVPTQEIIQKESLCENNFSSDVFYASSQIIESVIWDIISSKYFFQILKDYLNTTHNIKYTQLPIKIIQRKHQIKRNNFRLSKRYIENILHTMIYMIILEEFNLEIAHFSHPPDIRQISYEKTYTEIYEKLIQFE